MVRPVASGAEHTKHRLLLDLHYELPPGSRYIKYYLLCYRVGGKWHSFFVHFPKNYKEGGRAVGRGIERERERERE